MFVDVIRKFQISYKDLPINIYQFSNKFRDETVCTRWTSAGTRIYYERRIRSTPMRCRLKPTKKCGRRIKPFLNVLVLATIPVEADNGTLGERQRVRCCVTLESRFDTGDGSYAARRCCKVRSRLVNKDEKETNENSRTTNG